MNFALQLIGQLATQIPYLLALLVGGVLALIRWNRHPGVSAALLLAVVIQLVSAVGGVSLLTWLPRYLSDRGDGGPQIIAAIYNVVNLVRSGISAIAWGLVLFAVFSGRSGAQRPEA